MENSNEILFKAKSISDNEWKEGYYGIKGKDTDLELHCIMQSTLSNGTILNFYFSDINVKKETVCQFINETDIEDTKIFENDILRTNEAGWIGYVKRIGANFILTDNKGGFSAIPEWNKCKIIGNMIDNPELIKK